jgi:hypothetical protein
MVARQPLRAPAGAGGGDAFRIGSSTYRYGDVDAAGAGRSGAAAVLATAAAAAGSVLQRALGTPKIIYATRTHSQISQVVRELKRSGYLPRVSIMGSRSQVSNRSAAAIPTPGTRGIRMHALHSPLCPPFLFPSSRCSSVFTRA